MQLQTRHSFASRLLHTYFTAFQRCLPASAFKRLGEESLIRAKTQSTQSASLGIFHFRVSRRPAPVARANRANSELYGPNACTGCKRWPIPHPLSSVPKPTKSRSGGRRLLQASQARKFERKHLSFLGLYFFLNVPVPLPEVVEF